MDLEVSVEETIFQGDREQGATMTQCLARKLPKLRELESALGEKLPDRLSGIAVKRGAQLSEVQRRSYRAWAQGARGVARVTETSRIMDRPDSLLAAALAQQKSSKQQGAFPTFDDGGGPSGDAAGPQLGGVGGGGERGGGRRWR